MAQPPILLQGPEPVETADLHFKLFCKLKIFEPNTKYDSGKYSLVAVSQYYGVIFVGTSNGFSIIQTKSVKSTTNFNEYPVKEIPLSFRPTHILVDFSQKYLAVVVSSQPGTILYIYSIASLTCKNIAPIKVLYLSKLIQNLAAEVSEMIWQPNAEGILMVCMSDGSVLSINPSSKDDSVHTLPNSTQAVSFCWSPKGKQIVIGCANGCLSQFKPDLKLVKTLPAPPLFNGNVTVISVFWISSFQFAVSYKERNNPSSFPVFAIMNAPKNEPVNVINYDDITYSSSQSRPHHLYMSHQSDWNVIFISSANSIEVSVLHSKDNSGWEQWLLGDASRAELPLNAHRQETFPLGMAFDYTSCEAIPWGENTVPPMPRLLLLSDEGVLCVFNIVNIKSNAPQLCSAPKEQMPDNFFAIKPTSSAPSSLAVSSSSPALVPPFSAAVISPTLSANTTKPLEIQSSFGMSKPTFGFGFNTSDSGFSFQTQSTTPQVTVSIPGGNVIGGLKDITLPQQQQQQQQPILTQYQQPSSQQSQQPMTFSQNFPSPNLSQKFGTNTQLPGISTAAPAVPAFSFGTPLANSTFVSKTPVASTAPAPALASVPATVPATVPASTPVINVSVQSSKPTQPPVTPLTTLKEKANTQGDVLSGTKNVSQSTPAKPITSSTKSVPKEKSLEPKVDNGAVKITTPSGSPVTTLPELPAVDDSVYWNALQDEIDHFNSELKLLSKRMKNIDFQVGTPEDKVNLRMRMEQLREFWTELKETTIAQSSEIHSVVTDLMESFAWLEDAKSRNVQRKNSSFIELKKSEELDPINARHMNEIGHLKYYIENQLKQLTAHLEKEWTDHQDSYRTDVKNQMSIPPLEEVYKTMHYQLKILNKQRLLVEELKGKTLAKKRQNKSIDSLLVNVTPILPSSQGSNRVSELSKLADNLLQLKINREENISALENKKVLQSQLKTIHERSNRLTSEKQAALRDVLSERDMVKIRPMKTSMENSSFLRSLALEKSARKAAAAKAESKEADREKVLPSPVKAKGPSSPKPKNDEVKPKGKDESQEKAQTKKQEAAKNVFAFKNVTPNDRPSLVAAKPSVTPIQVAASPSVNERSPLASLTSVVTNLGQETGKKVGGMTFELRKPNVLSSAKDTFTFGSTEKSQKKPEESKPLTTFTFGSSSSSTTLFDKPLELPKFDGKLTFGSSTPTFGASKSAEPGKATTSTANSTSTFSFTFTTVSTATTDLPKMSVPFGSNAQNSSLSTFTLPSEGLFSKSTASDAPLFSSQNIFGTDKPGTTTTIASFTTVPSTQSSNFTFGRAADEKAAGSQIAVITPNPANENEEVDVENVDEPKKAEEPKSTVKPTTSNIFGAVISATSTQAKTGQITSTSSLSSSVTLSQSPTVTTMTLFGKPLLSTTACSSTTSSASIFGQGTTSNNVFSFGTSTSSPLIFGQAEATTTTTATVAATTSTTTTTAIATSTTPSQSAVAVVVSTPASSATVTTNSAITPSISTTSTANIFQQALTPTTASEKPSSTTPTTNLFGGVTPTTNIFGGASTPSSKPVFGTAAQAVTSSVPATGTIFGGSASPVTPITCAFGQPAATTSTSGFTDSVSQATNIFGQLLSDNTQSNNIFATSSTTSSTTANIFSTPKNIFGGSTTTSSTGSLFGASNSSLFGTSSPQQTASLFGGGQSSASQSGSTASIFGQTSPSNSFFGQNICSPFSTNTSVTSNQSTLESGAFGSKPIFGQSSFGQRTGSTSLFGASPNPSIFGGSLSTTTSFGSTSPGPFSSNQGSVAETGFKASNSFQKPMGLFGSAPVFGGAPSAPAFGMAPTFSGASTFGSQPTFGSSSSVFDSSQGSFAQPQGHSTTFENLANQNTVGFGNLAQQSQSQGFGGFNSAPAFENKTTFGGSSFSSWRSS